MPFLPKNSFLLDPGGLFISTFVLSSFKYRQTVDFHLNYYENIDYLKVMDLLNNYFSPFLLIYGIEIFRASAQDQLTSHRMGTDSVVSEDSR